MEALFKRAQVWAKANPSTAGIIVGFLVFLLILVVCF